MYEIKQIIDKTENALFDRCHFIEFGESSLNFELVYYFPTNDYLLAMNAQQKINLEIEENINFLNYEIDKEFWLKLIKENLIDPKSQIPKN